jgi:hypothetical protein
MTKDSLICFRTSKALHEALCQVAKEEQRSLSSTIEIVLTTYLREKKALHCVGNEKRQYPRKALSVPTVVDQPESGQMVIGTIMDISLGGVRVLIPKDFKHQILIDSQNSRFEIVFNLPAENKPLRLSYESKRVIDSEESVSVGAAFIDADLKSYKALQTYLM